MNAIEINALTKRYGQKDVLKKLDLCVKEGSLFALLGPNGSGKSTLVKTLTGIIKPDDGQAFVLGKSITENSFEIKNLTGVLPESLGLFAGLTIFEHLILSGDIYGLKRNQTLYRAEQLLKQLDLWEYRNTLASSGSFGMKKKCSLAMAIIHKPKIVFLDEPFEGIDPTSSKEIKEIFSILVKNRVTIFLTSHIIDTIEKIIDSFAIIQNGKIIYENRMSDIISEGSSLGDVYFNLIKNEVSGDLRWLAN
jgi:ABC-2 type transport system ATP-binding protein